MSICWSRTPYDQDLLPNLTQAMSEELQVGSDNNNQAIWGKLAEHKRCKAKVQEEAWLEAERQEQAWLKEERVHTEAEVQREEAMCKAEEARKADALVGSSTRARSNVEVMNPWLNNSLRNTQDTIATIEGQHNQWNALPADVIQRRIEVMANPGQYASDQAKFSEWWVKMKVWVMQNRTTLPTTQDKCTTVWSRMTGPVAGRFAQAKFSLAIITRVWPDTAEMIEDIDRFFTPQTDVEWAKAQMHMMRQGNSQYKEFYAKFESLKVQGHVTDETAGFLLENAIHPAIVKEALRRGYTQGNYLQMTIAFQEAALARDRFKLLYNHYPDEPAPRSSYNRPSYSPHFTPTSTQPGCGTPMEIGAARFPPRPIPTHIKCFDCQGNCYERDCPRAKGKGSARPNIWEVMQEAQEAALQQMSFEEMQAFFYDKQVNEMKTQGKEFSQ
ncbi:hypothetical protein M404DRAFT_23796 [Pisolithus tinctorius Marx 270]|uniref:Retrotransposon gag domain-containing protein n=1 Tax=Pisolithus tinctorius Marx 270 TaxID=870435 RepID=A0A0C3KCE2_PISTI|nr:hypothetical protein M404DRAFT_23796 [Pisolithus tinctorius Marx 270]